jgi:crotonobetainyl-CoA:carnitine CoA-transferase CaiB-like acyl-CoA transferase
VVLQAEAGFLYMTGEPGRPPVKMPVALIDLMAAHQLKEGILLALLHRERSGEGSVVTTSLLESALASLANQATNYLMAGHVPQPMGTRHPNIAPYGDIFVCSDGEPLLLAAGTEKQFKNLCSALKAETLSTDERFETNGARVRNRDVLNTYLADLFRRDTAAAWLNLMNRYGVPAARIRNMQAVFDMPEAQNMVLESQTHDGQTAKCLKSVAFTWKP